MPMLSFDFSFANTYAAEQLGAPTKPIKPSNTF